MISPQVPPDPVTPVVFTPKVSTVLVCLPPLSDTLTIIPQDGQSLLPGLGDHLGVFGDLAAHQRVPGGLLAARPLAGRLLRGRLRSGRGNPANGHGAGVARPGCSLSPARPIRPGKVPEHCRSDGLYPRKQTLGSPLESSLW